MKKTLSLLFCIFLSGCGPFPKFYDETQPIFFVTPNPLEITVQNYGRVENSQIQVNREFKSLEATLTKDGFMDKKIEIKSHWTDDKWATYCSKKPGTNECLHEDMSALTLLPPTQTIMQLGFGAVIDILNLVTLAWPRVVIKNPWYEYDRIVDLSKEILTPTPEFTAQCHNKKDYFIGNNDCVSCKTKDWVISTQEECERCSNREWLNVECHLKANGQ